MTPKIFVVAATEEILSSVFNRPDSSVNVEM